MRAVSVTALLLLGALLFCGFSDAARTKAKDLTAAYSFAQYVKEYGKPYLPDSAEWYTRQRNFGEALRRVLAHNARPGVTYLKGINQLSDWHVSELNGRRGVRHPNGNKAYRGQSERAYKRTLVGDPPDEMDYRTAFPSVLTAVKDQGMCGDCWAHAVTEATESAYAMKTGNLFVLSQQQVTDCTPASGGCYSCDGSYPRLAYDYLANTARHLTEEWTYSFQSWNGTMPTCNVSKVNASGGVAIEGYTQIPYNDEPAAKAALAENGPLSILVDASAWNDYESGVFTGCDPHNSSMFGLDHAVLLVGYGHDSATGLDYWIVRNSWSAAWGENGYIRIHRSQPNHCSTIPSLTCLNSNATMQSCGPCGILTDVQYPNVVVRSRRQLK